MKNLTIKIFSIFILFQFIHIHVFAQIGGGDLSDDKFKINADGDTYTDVGERVLIGYSSEPNASPNDDLLVRENMVVGTSRGIAGTTLTGLDTGRGLFFGDAGCILDFPNTETLDVVGRDNIRFMVDEKSGVVKIAMYINVNGQVGINGGTTDTDYKLAIGGKIITEEAKIRLVTDWPDYVFEPEYELTPLAELESQISELGHLPNMPSAEEVAEEGILLGEMDAKILEKIEELTLHLIEMNKSVNKLKEENQRLKKQLKEKN